MGGPRTDFLVSDADVAGVGTSFAVAKVVTFKKNVSRDALSEDLYSSFRLWSLEGHFLATAGTPTLVQAAIWWDSTCDILLAGPSDEVPVMLAGTTPSLYTASIPIDSRRRRVSGGTALQLFAWFKFDAGTVTIKTCRLHFSE